MATIWDLFDAKTPKERAGKILEMLRTDARSPGHPLAMSPPGIAYRAVMDGPKMLQGVWDTFTTPGDILAGKKKATVPDAAKFALDVGLGGFAVGSAPKGALRTFAGQNAKTADMGALAKAEAMEKAGSGRDEIWTATGWGRGADGKWRWEIDDSKRAVDIPGAANRRDDEAFKNAEILEMAAMIRSRAESRGITLGEAAASISKELNKNVSDTAFSLAASPLKTEQLRKNAENAWPIDKYAEPFKTGDVMRHDELFKAYPDMARTELKVGNDVGVGYKAAYDTDADKFYLQKYMDRDRDYSLGHEIQHRAQSKEGFAQGGNTYTTIVDELQPIQSKIDALAKDGAWNGFDAWRNSPGIKSKGWSHNETVAEYMKSHPGDVRFRELAGLEDRKRTLMVRGSDDYRKLVGEVEARNVQTRKDMTAAERRATPPWKTADTPEADQIIRYHRRDGETRNDAIGRILLGN